MPHDLIRAPGHDRRRSLGWLATRWIEHFCLYGRGDVAGKHLHLAYPDAIPLSNELVELIVDAYALEADGRRMYDAVFYSRPKGSNKSGVAAWIGLFEAMGPCRFDGWAKGGEVYEYLGFRYVYQAGEPMGRPITHPFLRIMATEESQTGHVYDELMYTLVNGPLRLAFDRGDDIGLGRVILPDGGEIRPSTASSSAKDGGLESWACFDEPLALDTPIPTTTGWKVMGEVEPGDYVFGPDGRPVLVYGVAPIKTGRPCYRVTFDDGTTIVADAVHRWAVFERHTRKWRERTTAEMANARHYRGRPRYDVARPAPLEMPERDLPIDPYVLGLWLGDGDSRAAKIAVGPEDCEAILAELCRLGFRTTVYAYDPAKSAVMIGISQSEYGERLKSTQGELRRLGVIGNKHVPDVYLWGSRSQRLSLLQGLMDSDGYTNERGNCVFTNTSRELADAVVHLVRSLGWRTSAGHWASDERWGARVTGTWRVSFTPDGDVPFRLPRKAERCRVHARTSRRAIVSVEPADSVPVRCIAVDSDDHLFLAGPGMLPTHNCHLYYKPELIRMYETVTRNLAKRNEAQPWAFIPTTMYEPGRGSIAELLHEEARDILAGTAAASRLYFNHRYASADTNMDDDASFEAGLREAYGDAADYIDIKGLIARRRSKTASREYTAQFFLNQATASGGRAFDLARWDASVVEKTKKYRKPGEMIALGFDGSRTQDSTSLKATHIESGFQWRIATWERPEHAGPDWEVPEAEVDAAVAEAFRTYRVVLMYADTSKWEAAVARWAGLYNHGDDSKAVVVKWPVQLHKKTAIAIKAYANAIQNGEVLHGEDPVARRHLANAYRLPQNFTDDDGSPLWLIMKERAMSPNKIDDAYAGVLSWQARNDAIAKGALNEKGPSIYESRGVIRV